MGLVFGTSLVGLRFLTLITTAITLLRPLPLGAAARARELARLVLDVDGAVLFDPAAAHIHDDRHSRPVARCAGALCHPLLCLVLRRLGGGPTRPPALPLSRGALSRARNADEVQRRIDWRRRCFHDPGAARPARPPRQPAPLCSRCAERDAAVPHALLEHRRRLSVGEVPSRPVREPVRRRCHEHPPSQAAPHRDVARAGAVHVHRYGGLPVSSRPFRLCRHAALDQQVGSSLRPRLSLSGCR